MRSLPLILLCPLVLATAHGQDEPAPPATLTALLRDALSPTALEGLVGVRHFKDDRGGLVTVTGSLDVETQPTTLRCEATFQAVGAMRKESLTLRCALGLDGAVHSSGFTLVRGRHEARADGVVREGKLEVTARETNGEHTESRTVSVPWGADVLPYSVAAFFAPLLDLPAGLRVRVFHPVTLAVNERPSTLLRGEPSAYTLTDAMPGMELVVRVNAGAITEVRLGEKERYVRITAEQARDLLHAPAPR